MPLELDDDVPNVEASFDGLPPARFLIDTGDSEWARLYAPYIQRNGLAQKYPKGMDVYSEGVGGIVKDRRVLARTFTIAGTTIKDLPTDLALNAKGGSSRVLAGALGLEFLSHFVVTFDYPHKRLFLAPNTDAQKPFDTRTFGFYVMLLPDALSRKKMDTVIVGVAPKSPAADAGLANGSTLVKVDGRSVADLGLAETRRLLSADGGQDTHEISIIGPQGGTGTLKVRLYDPMPRNGDKLTRGAPS